MEIFGESPGKVECSNQPCPTAHSKKGYWKSPALILKRKTVRQRLRRSTVLRDDNAEIRLTRQLWLLSTHNRYLHTMIEVKEEWLTRAISRREIENGNQSSSFAPNRARGGGGNFSQFLEHEGLHRGLTENITVSIRENLPVKWSENNERLRPWYTTNKAANNGRGESIPGKRV